MERWKNCIYRGEIMCDNTVCGVCGQPLVYDDGWVSCPVYIDGVDDDYEEHDSYVAFLVPDKREVQ